VVLGVASSGLHSNGFSLARAVLPWREDAALAAELLTPTRIYVRAVAAVCAAAEVRGIAHITGGGLPGNLPRIFPDGLGARLRADSWAVPALFERIAREGPVERGEMLETFNMGVGLCVVVPPGSAAAAIAALAGAGEVAWRLGEVVPGEGVAWV
jgi:phosphoribosylformylglycinamidine cyclo-ligase